MRYIVILIAGFALAGCVDATQSISKDGTAADPVAVDFAGDSKADGSPFAQYQGHIDLEERHDAELPRPTGYHMWTFDAEADSELYIDVASRDGDDMYLLLYRETADGWSYLDGNDDCYSGTFNACLTVNTDAGRYLALVSTYRYLALNRPTPASYEIEIFCNDGCVAEPKMCGSRGLDPCPDGQFCDWPDDACGAADRPGVCQTIPEVCPLNYAPICGCDGRTFSNTCFAARHGIDMAELGECAPDGQGEGELCGGIAGFQCQTGLKCDYSANTSCNISDMAGTCVLDEPTICTLQYDPVCGCDGVTYSNECFRRGAGVAFDHDGECN